jgi:SH3 domain-containing YSC84-like protein 1
MVATYQILSRILVVAGVLTAASGCSSSTSEPAKSPEPAAETAESLGPPEQITVDRAAAVLDRMQTKPEFASLHGYMQHARGVMIFPHVRKGALIFGGEGGTGVMVARDASGNWSSPAFCSLGGASFGLQAGYEDAAVVLVFMSEPAFRAAMETGVKLGADATVAAGTAGGAAATNTAKDVYQFVDAGGGFAGASLDGSVVSSRESQNQEYYGANNATSGRILVDRRISNRIGTDSLKLALDRAS